MSINLSPIHASLAHIQVLVYHISLNYLKMPAEIHICIWFETWIVYLNVISLNDISQIKVENKVNQ